MSSNRARVAALLGALALPLAACTAQTGSASSVEGGAEQEVLASFYPLQYVAEQVGGEHVVVEPLTPPGTEPHDLELAPFDVARMETAELVVYLSGFQPAVDDAVAQATPQRTLDVSGPADLVAEHAHDHDDDAHTEDDGHGHEAAGGDPHFWLDPVRLAQVGEAVADELAAMDPDRAADYTANAARLSEELTALDEELAAGLTSCASRTIVVSHEAYGYLADSYDLDQVGIAGIDPDTEPSPARLAEITEVVRDQGVSTVFTDSPVGAKVAETLAGDLGVATAVLDPLETLTQEGSDYQQVMRANLDALAEALGCR